MKLAKLILGVRGLFGDSSEEQHRLVMVSPEDYLGAAGESLFFTILTAWSMSFFYSYENLLDNPLKDIFGYNNACVAWDVPPALYTSSWLFICPVYCSMRYAVLALKRASMGGLTGWKMTITRIACICYFFSFSVVPLIFVVLPSVNAKAHTMLFTQLIFFRWFVVAANFLTADEGTLRPSNWRFLIIYGIISGGLLTSAFINLALAVPGGSPSVPPYVQMPLDALWFICLPLTSKFLPNTKALAMELKLEDVEQGVLPTRGVRCDIAACCDAICDDIVVPRAPPREQRVLLFKQDAFGPACLNRESRTLLAGSPVFAAACEELKGNPQHDI